MATAEGRLSASETPSNTLNEAATYCYRRGHSPDARRGGARRRRGPFDLALLQPADAGRHRRSTTRPSPRRRGSRSSPTTSRAARRSNITAETMAQTREDPARHRRQGGERLDGPVARDRSPRAAPTSPSGPATTSSRCRSWRRAASASSRSPRTSSGPHGRARRRAPARRPRAARRAHASSCRSSATSSSRSIPIPREDGARHHGPLHADEFRLPLTPMTAEEPRGPRATLREHGLV